MAAQIQAFMLACPVSPTAGRAVRWDQLKVHIQDVARNYCSTFHADRTKQLRALRGRCPFPSGKQPSRTPDEPEMCTNNDLNCTRRSVHREKSPERGWQSILGPRRPANVAGHVVEHGESTYKQRRTIACMQEDMQAVSGNAA
ncbi:hypothetical protein ABBQ32_003703 [Trebouxia sp. C0010 RCD-2024]